MCLILFANNIHPRYRLILSANRDEYYARPTAPLGAWHDCPQILAGRDLLEMGTWMGITGGRFAAVTNYRAPQAEKTGAPSRGGLVAGFLRGTASAAEYMDIIWRNGNHYNGFNLIAGDQQGIFYYSNRNGVVEVVAPGIHGISNHFFDTPWPKVSRGRQALSDLVAANETLEPWQLIDLLTDQEPVGDDQLPDTGVGLARERLLSPIFITSEEYGTRSSSALLIEYSGRIVLCEQTWRPAQRLPVSGGLRCFDFHCPYRPAV